MTEEQTVEQEIRHPLSLGFWLIVTGVIGWVSSFQLTLDKLLYLADPDAELSCNFGITVQCGTNLNSAQGELFGFPNPLVGMAAFMVPIIFGVLVLAGVKLPRWIWIGFLAGVSLGFIWVVWFIYQSIYVLESLCPWCMTMWTAMIPMFFMVLFYNIRAGHFGSARTTRRVGEELYSWTWVIALASYFTIALLAQLHLDVINRF